uniref:DUF3510 domain-containing protein n=1 Tax=Macrostomum lignano TaxID=282301 RepID=A0A1I8ISX2_9PLAT
PDADPKLLASHLRALTSLIASAASSAAESAASADYPDCLLAAPLDVYRDPAPDAAAACLAPLARLSIRLGELLGQWPENATLVAAKEAGRRVMSFNVRDPLMKFVTGVDLVLAELQRWRRWRRTSVANDGAAPAVRRYHRMATDGAQPQTGILQQLEGLSRPLPVRFRQSAARWLLPLAGILNDCTQPAQKCNASQLCQSLCQFLDRASLGDFSARLDCVGLLERLSDDWLLDDQCRSVLANARAYYAQYLPAVAAAARERRAGSSLSLRRVFDFIKIVKWSDMNFWSVRASVDRSHRAVLKAVKQLEELLRESALSAGCFSLPESANHKSTNSDVDLSEGDEVAHFATQLTAELAKPTTVVVSSELAKFEAEFLPRSPQLAERIRRLAPTSAASEAAAAAVTSSVSGVAELCQRIVESSRQLRDMAPEQTDSRERYERQASQIQRLKRKALSDLFKTLQQAGLSYRKGRLAALSSLDEHRCLLFSFASFHQRDCHAGQHLLRGMHRRLAMTSTLTGGACTKELGLDGIERCDGFSLHLQRLLADLCRLLSRHARQLRPAGRRCRGRRRCAGHSAPTLWAEYFSGLQPAAGTAGCQGDGSDCPAYARPSAAAELLRPPPDNNLAGWLPGALRQLAELHRRPADGQVLVNPFNSIADAIEAASGEVENGSVAEQSPSCCSTSSASMVECAEALVKSVLPWPRLTKAVMKTRTLLTASCLSLPALTVLFSLDRTLTVPSLLAAADRLVDLIDCSPTEDFNAAKAASEPLIAFLQHLYAPYLASGLAALRHLAQLWSVLNSVFHDLLANGYCRPPPFAEEDDSSAAADSANGRQFKDVAGGGLGEGEGATDVSEQIESEDQLEGLKGDKEGDNEDQQKDIQEQPDGVEMSDDFNAPMPTTSTGISGAKEDDEKGEDDKEGGADEEEKKKREERGPGVAAEEQEASAVGVDENEQQQSKPGDAANEEEDRKKKPAKKKGEKEAEKDDEAEEPMDEDGAAALPDDGQGASSQQQQQQSAASHSQQQQQQQRSLDSSNATGCQQSTTANDTAPDSGDDDDNQPDSQSWRRRQPDSQDGADRQQQQQQRQSRRRRRPEAEEAQHRRTNVDRADADDSKSKRRANLVEAGKEDDNADDEDHEGTEADTYQHLAPRDDEAEQPTEDAEALDSAGRDHNRARLGSDDDQQDEDTTAKDKEQLERLEPDADDQPAEQSKQKPLQQRNRRSELRPDGESGRGVAAGHAGAADAQPARRSAGHGAGGARAGLLHLGDRHRQEEATPSMLQTQPPVQMALSTTGPPATAALTAWTECQRRTESLSRQLAEQLRAVLQPTRAARLQGDYRSGRRLNMRKLVPYVASQMRKDRIWLRRCKPSKREYQVLLAIDDSQSMLANRADQFTVDSLAVLSGALNTIESGQLAVCKFGAQPAELLHPLDQPFTAEAAAGVAAKLTFQQADTKLMQLLPLATQLLAESRTSSAAQLLLVLTDGTFSDHMHPGVERCLRLAREARIFPVCVILDSPAGRASVYDIRSQQFVREAQGAR